MVRSFPYLGSDSDNVLTGDLTGDFMSGFKKKKKSQDSKHSRENQISYELQCNNNTWHYSTALICWHYCKRRGNRGIRCWNRNALLTRDKTSYISKYRRFAGAKITPVQSSNNNLNFQLQKVLNDNHANN